MRSRLVKEKAHILLRCRSPRPTLPYHSFTETPRSRDQIVFGKDRVLDSQADVPLFQQRSSPAALLRDNGIRHVRDESEVVDVGAGLTLGVSS